MNQENCVLWGGKGQQPRREGRTGENGGVRSTSLLLWAKQKGKRGEKKRGG